MPVRTSSSSPSSSSFGGSGSTRYSSGWPTFASSAYTRRPNSLLPFAMGAFGGTAAYSALSRNRGAICDGRNVVCYRSYCERARDQCPSAARSELVAVRCPTSLGETYSECYTTRDVNFFCLGRPRPSQSRNMDAYCAEESRSGGGSRPAAATGTAAPAARTNSGSGGSAAPAAKPAATSASAPASSPKPPPPPPPPPPAGPQIVVGLQTEEEARRQQQSGSSAPAPAPAPGGRSQVSLVPDSGSSSSAAPAPAPASSTTTDSRQQASNPINAGAAALTGLVAGAAGILLANQG